MSTCLYVLPAYVILATFGVNSELFDIHVWFKRPKSKAQSMMIRFINAFLSATIC